MNQVADDVCTRYVYNRSAFISDRFDWQEERIRVVPRNHSSLIWDEWFLFLCNRIHAFRGLSECLHNETCNISFVQSASINLNADFLICESRKAKMFREDAGNILMEMIKEK